MKKTTNNLILCNMLFAVSLVIANVVTAKTIETGIPLFGGTIQLPGAAVCYAITFLMTDVIGEIWGKKEANVCVRWGFIAQVLATTLIIFTQKLPATSEEMQSSYDMLLGQNYIFVIGSLVAYFVSQSWDVWVFHKIRDKFNKDPKKRWIWNNASTMTSQIFDTVIFVGISFGFGFGWLFKEEMCPALGAMMIGQYLLKFALAAIDTPIFYLLTRKRKGEVSGQTEQV